MFLRPWSEWPKGRHQLEDHCWIDVAAAGPHDQTLQRGHAHACLRGGAELNGAGAGPVPEMA